MDGDISGEKAVVTDEYRADTGSGSIHGCVVGSHRGYGSGEG